MTTTEIPAPEETPLPGPQAGDGAKEGGGAEPDGTTGAPARQAGTRWRFAALVGNRQTSVYSVFEHVLLGAIAFVPLLVVKRGVETSDTKTYLYLDPGRFLHQVASMWDPSVALGTVTHEYIGYLFPMGPFYWFFSVIGVPVWVAQRLWLGAILFAAGAGTLMLCRTLNVRAPGRTVAALAFMLSPYVLQYGGRISVILLPFAGLPFMVAFTVRALRRAGWRYPALFALTVALTSGINASSIIYVGVAPLLWLVFAVVVLREASARRALVVAGKIALLTFLCSLWWIAGLLVEAGYGVDVLRYTETLPSTSETSSAAEVIRGLGYWYFYGGDRLGPWTQSAVLYTQQLWLIAVSYLVPVVSFVAAIAVRWRYRAYFVALLLVGVVLSVGPHPYEGPTPLGGLLKQFMSRTTAGLALRSTDRATPLVVLASAVLLGSAISAIRIRRRALSAAAAVLVGGAVIADNPALFNGDAEVVSFFTQPAKLPSYELAAIAHLNSTHPGTRVLAIPGNNFASFRWGDTVDTPQPAFLNRQFVTREQQVMGSIATADTLYAMDDPDQLGIAQWNALAPMARLLSAGDVLVQYDQRFEHYGTPQPQLLASQLQPTPLGLTDPVSFGSPRPNVPSFAMTDGQVLAAGTTTAPTAPLVDYTVSDPRPVTRAESDSGALIVSGDATGLEELATLGMLDTTSAIYYSGTLDSKASQLEQLLHQGADLVVTDTNRKQAFRWDTLTANYGETETPSEDPASTDPSDSPIDLFPAAPADAKTVASYVGAVDVTASSYGDTVSYTPENRAFSAIDGNLDTAWSTGTFLPDPAGQWWQARFSSPVKADQVTLVQTQTGNRSRWITRVTLSFDGGRAITEDLGPQSRAPTGQVVRFPSRSFRTMRVTIDSTSDDHMPAASATAVGLAEVEVPGQHVVEVLKMPQDLLDSAGTASIHNRLTVSMTRQRVSQYSLPVRTDPETTISREFTLPTSRTFSLSGSASLSALIPDDEIDRLVGRPGPGAGGVDAYSEARLPGDLTATAAAAADGDPATYWQPGFGSAYQLGEWLEYDLAAPVTFDHLALEVVADGRHSVPTSLMVTTETGSREVTLPPINDGSQPGSVVAVPLSFPAITGQDVRITVTGVRTEKSTNYYAPNPIALPLGIAEVGIPGVHAAAVPPRLPGQCVSNLLAIDGRPVSVKIEGPTSTALGGGEVSVVPCGPDVNGIILGRGPHVVESALGHTSTTGWNIDQLTLDSAPGGGAMSAPFLFDLLPSAQPGASPEVRVSHVTPTSEQVRVTGARSAFELVLGESSNSGWKAVASPSNAAGGVGGSGPGGVGGIDLGSSELVDGFANGWQVTASDLSALGADKTGSFTVDLTWTPQRRIWIALVVSAFVILVCTVLAVFDPRWMRRRVELAAPVSTLGDEAPVLASPLEHRGTRPSWPVLVVATLATGLVAGAITEPVVGLVAGAATAAGLLVRRVRGPVALAAVGLLVAAGTWVVVGQATNGVPESSNWVSSYATAGTLAWFAVVALGVDAVIDVVRRRRSPPQSEVAQKPDG
jgi:arabinofuranan 3-O-arabinosyltransferase